MQDLIHHYGQRETIRTTENTAATSIHNFKIAILNIHCKKLNQSMGLGILFY